MKNILIISLVLTAMPAATWASSFTLGIYDRPDGKWTVQMCNSKGKCVRQVREAQEHNCDIEFCHKEEKEAIKKLDADLLKKAEKELSND